MSRSIKKKNLFGEYRCFRVVFVLLSILLYACSERQEIPIPEEFAALENLSVYATDSEPKYDINLEPVTVFGDTEDVLLGSRLMMAADNRGRVYIADNQEIALHAYNPDGSYHRQVGRAGDGPGEYRMIISMQTDDRYLHLMDPNLNRITRYNLDTFEVVGNITLSIDREGSEGIFRYPQSFHLTDTNTYLLQLGSSFSRRENLEEVKRTITGMKLNYMTNETVDSTVFSFPSNELLIHREGNSVMYMYVPYKRKPGISVQNGQIIHGWSDSFFLKVYDDNGQYQRAIYYPFENIPLDRNEVLDMFSGHEEQWQNMVRGDDMPDTWPMFDSFIVDDEGRIWVEKLTESRDESEYVVLANSGELLATFNWPSDKEVQEIKNGFLYTLETNEETRLQEIVKYGVLFEEG